MKEIPSEHESELAQWVPASALMPMEYWMGSTYRGAYWNRLEFDIAGISGICREGLLPPVVLKNDVWTPPVTHGADMVAPNLSAFKKVSFSPKKRISEPTPYFQLTSTDVTVSVFGHVMPVGWDIRMNDRKILHDFEYTHPKATKTEAEEFFIRMFDRQIRTALIHVALEEAISTRHTESHLFGGIKMRNQIIAAITAGLLSQPNDVLKLMWGSAYLQTLMTLFEPLQVYAMTRLLNKEKRNPYQRFHNTNLHNSTVTWRYQHFPEVFLREYDMSLAPRRLLFSAIPIGGFLLADVLSTLDAGMRRKSPLVRLSPAV